MKAEDIINLLKMKYADKRFVKITELRFGTGYNTRKNKNIESRIDFWCINTYPSNKYKKISWEIKISKSDFMKEIINSEKRKAALIISNEFFYIAPVNIIPIELVPEECGLIEIGQNNEWIITKKAPYRQCIEPNWNFISSLARRTAKNEGIDFGNISPEILKSLVTVLKSATKLNGTETLLLEFLLIEVSP